jgi:hypothetical protein
MVPAGVYIVQVRIGHVTANTTYIEVIDSHTSTGDHVQSDANKALKYGLGIGISVILVGVIIVSCRRHGRGLATKCARGSRSGGGEKYRHVEPLTAELSSTSTTVDMSKAS